MINNVEKLQKYLINQLIKQYGEEISNKIIEGYASQRVVSFRVNNLKSTVPKVSKELIQNGILFERVQWSDTAFIVKNVTEQEIEKLDIYEKGDIYLQSLSSMLPPIILEPKENTDILDMTAAPGGKTTQIVSITLNKANITACEMNNIRADKLKYNLEKQGASNVVLLREDSRKLSDYFAFDQILLDAPCSGSGTIRINEEKTYKNFNERLVQKSTQSQITLLKKALRILKPGHEMIYSTCSILQLENEEIINKVLNSENVEIVPINIEGINNIPVLPTKIKGTLCVCPNEYYDGFFIAKIRKLSK